jgi:hypothetical protein
MTVSEDIKELKVEIINLKVLLKSHGICDKKELPKEQVFHPNRIRNYQDD